MWNRDSRVNVVSLHWWPRHDWSFLWPCLRRASSWTITRPSCRQCDNPTWSHTALLSQFHACCRSSFWLHNRRSRLLGGGSPVESLQSHFILTMSHWSSGLPVCFLSQGTWVQNPWGDLCDTGILLLALSRYKRILYVWGVLPVEEGTSQCPCTVKDIKTGKRIRRKGNFFRCQPTNGASVLRPQRVLVLSEQLWKILTGKNIIQGSNTSGGFHNIHYHVAGLQGLKTQEKTKGETTKKGITKL
jgi:hypothetical protein